MISRRALVGGAAAAAVAGVGAAHLLDVDDDALRALGAEPHPEPDPGDVRLLAAARRDQSGLVDALTEVARREPAAEPLATVAREQLDAVGGAVADPTVAPTDPAALAGHAADLAEARAADALVAVSVDLVRVLASHAAGLDQLARRLSGIG